MDDEMLQAIPQEQYPEDGAEAAQAWYMAMEPGDECFVMDVITRESRCKALIGASGGLTPRGIRRPDHIVALIPDDDDDGRVLAILSTGCAGVLDQHDAAQLRPVIDRLALHGTVLAAEGSINPHWRRGKPSKRMTLRLTTPHPERMLEALELEGYGGSGAGGGDVRDSQDRPAG